MRFDVPDAIMALAFPTGATSEGFAEPGGRRGTSVRASWPRNTQSGPEDTARRETPFPGKRGQYFPTPPPRGGKRKIPGGAGALPGVSPRFLQLWEVLPVSGVQL